MRSKDRCWLWAIVPKESPANHNVGMPNWLFLVQSADIKLAPISVYHPEG